MLRVRGLSFSYPNGKLALVDFGLAVEAGELVVVLGGNGSGKTTLLRCITRTLRPNAGEIWLADTNLPGRGAAARSSGAYDSGKPERPSDPARRRFPAGIKGRLGHPFFRGH